MVWFFGVGVEWYDDDKKRYDKYEQVGVLASRRRRD